MKRSVTSVLACLATAAFLASASADDAIPVNVQSAVDRGLSWLANQQRANGSFQELNAVNSLAIMAFLARGHVPGQGPYGDRINRAIDYILAHQQPSGLLSATTGNHAMYDHGITTCMLCECYGMVDEPRRKKIDAAVGKAVRVIIDSQRVDKSPDNAGGWRYEPTSNDSDISVTGWQLMALRSAANNGASVPKATIDDGIAYIRHRAVANGGFTYTGSSGETPARTGTGVLALTLLGQHDSPLALHGGDYLLASPPLNDSSEVYYYRAYYTAQAANQLGGKYWTGIYPQIRDSLIHRAQQNGAWPQQPGLESQGGDVYSTAMAILVLAIPYRSLPLYQR